MCPPVSTFFFHLLESTFVTTGVSYVLSIEVLVVGSPLSHPPLQWSGVLDRVPLPPTPTPSPVPTKIIGEVGLHRDLGQDLGDGHFGFTVNRTTHLQLGCCIRSLGTDTRPPVVPVRP